MNTMLLLSVISSFAPAQANFVEPSCRILDQSGTLFSGCNNGGKWRCYADVRYETGERRKVWGACAESVSDCWSSGRSVVFPACAQ